MQIVGIDAFSLGPNHYIGKGNYILSLINGLLEIRDDIGYNLFLPKNSDRILTFPSQDVKLITTPSFCSYTLWSQSELPFYF